MSFLRLATIFALAPLMAGCCALFPDRCEPDPPRPQAVLKLENYQHHNGAGSQVSFEVLNEGQPLQSAGRQAIYAVRTTESGAISRAQRLWRQDGYIRARLQIEQIGGSATIATDPSLLARAFSSIWNENQEFAALVSVASASQPDANLVVPVVRSRRQTNQAANPEVNNGTVLLLPALINGGDTYTITFQFSWGDGVETKLPGPALEAMKTAAGLASGIPAPLPATLAGISNDQRTAANKAVSEALSTSVPAKPITLTLSSNQLSDARAILISIFDRDHTDVTDPKQQTLLRFRIDFEPMLSLLTEHVTQDARPDFSEFSADRYTRPFAQRQPYETPRVLVQRKELEDQTNDWRDYHRLCTNVSGVFSGAGFNTADSQALRWAALEKARSKLDLIIADGDGRTPCPEEELRISSSGRAARRVP